MYKGLKGGSWDTNADNTGAVDFSADFIRQWRNETVGFRLAMKPEKKQTMQENINLFIVTSCNLWNRAALHNITPGDIQIHLSQTQAETSAGNRAMRSNNKLYLYEVTITNFLPDELARAMFLNELRHWKLYVLKCIMHSSTCVKYHKTYKRVTRKYDVEITEA